LCCVDENIKKHLYFYFSFLFYFFFVEAITGCAPPNFKVTRPKGKASTTEQPLLTFETTQLYLPQDFTTHDLEFVDGKAKDKQTGSIVSEQIGKDAQKDSTKVKENPYWFDEWIVKDAEQHYHPENAHHHHHHHNTRRAKRNHNRKLKTIHFPEKKHSKRSIDYQDDEIIIPDEVYSPSEVIGNIFNENDTRRSVESDGKDDGMT
jgi:hypothetical protein